MNISWTSDLHLDHLDRAQMRAFLDSLRNLPSGLFVMAGDITVAPALRATLASIKENLNIPGYFVLGNHDFYHGSRRAVTAETTRTHGSDAALCYLSASAPHEVEKGVALIGHDGWADARAGDFDYSTGVISEHPIVRKHLDTATSMEEREVVWRHLSPLIRSLGVPEIADYSKIEEFTSFVTPEARRHMMSLWADAAASTIRARIRLVKPWAKKVVVVTHVPPFIDAARAPDGGPGSSAWLPHMVSVAMGDMLLEEAAGNPSISFVVLCGHTHTANVVEPTPNLRVLVHGSDYGAPTVENLVL